MNNLRYLTLIALFGLLTLASCKKDKDNEGSSAYTALKVYVIDSTGQAVKGANVGIFDSKDNRDIDVNAIDQAITLSLGYAYFTEIEATTYYVFVKKDNGDGTTSTGKGDTVVPIKSKDETAITIRLE